MNQIECDYVIVGAGIVGMSIAHQLNLKFPNKNIYILEKEGDVGFHSSGRNSGVLHAGIYYEPNTLKAHLCIEGAKKLKSWCKEHGVNILQCGKVITPQNLELDFQIDVLFERALKNGANVEIIDQKKFNEIVPNGRTSSGRALWSPNTSVVSPKEVLEKLKSILLESNIKFLFNSKISKFDQFEQKIQINNLIKNTKMKIKFKHLFNCAGLQSDQVGKIFGIGNQFKLIPFKGSYWKLKEKSNLSFKTNLYPVPDLNMPFLGVHITPSIEGSIYLGPTAVPALGAENYYGFQGIEILNTLRNIGILGDQWLNNKNNFRVYSRQQALLGLKSLFFRSAKLLIPNLEINDLLKCKKVGIRPQLFDNKTGNLLKDFYIENASCSTHVLNAISPAFTSSFAFADYVINFGINK